MALVTLRVLSDDSIPVPVAGVLIEFYDTSAIFQTSGTTDVDGEVVVSLPIADYDVIFYKVGVSILPAQPVRISIVDTNPHTFEATAHVRSLPESTNPDRCKVSGYIMGIDGGRYKTSIVFRTVDDLIVSKGNIVAMQGRVEVYSDDTGYFEFELLRDTAYIASFVVPRGLFTEDPGLIKVITPDGPAVQLHAFLFPIPVNMDFSANSISLVAGALPDESITYTLTFNDGSERVSLSSPWGSVFLQNSDNLVVEACSLDGKLSLKPLRAGTATITTIREIPSTTDYDPLPDYVTESVVVTVT